VIGERGVKLSGGQKQRLAIARAVLRNAPILILDEATSALDSASEQVVQQAMIHLMKDRTTFVIAHRLSTIRHADTIVVLHEGRMVEKGCHETLLARQGHYHRLYELQFKSQEERVVRTSLGTAPLGSDG
jgi:subfamily B ATP-binding cassette protein MsbA